MKYWQEDLLGIIDGAHCDHATFEKVETGARALGFEHCALGLRPWTARCTAVPQSQNNHLEQLRRVMVGPVYQ